MTDMVGNDALQAASQAGDKLRVTLTGSQQLRRGALLRRRTLLALQSPTCSASCSAERPRLEAGARSDPTVPAR